MNEVERAEGPKKSGCEAAQRALVSCPDLYSPAAKNAFRSVSMVVMRGVTVMTYSVIAGDRVGIT